LVTEETAADPKQVRVLYTAEATATGGRRGQAKTSDGRLEVRFSSPSELGGDGGPGTNPEQLLALGFAACYQNAMLGIAMRKGLEANDSVVTCRVGFGPIAAGRFSFDIELLIRLPSVAERDAAQALVEEAERRCPFSNAVRDNVRVAYTLVDTAV
jgi:lipoyl-dependent peroxiredoxin